MALPDLPTNWIWPLSAKLLGLWRGLNNGTLLVDANGNAPNVPDLNAVAPLEMAYNAPQSRFDLSIDPDALTTEVPVGNSVYVDAENGSADGTPGDAGDPFDTITAGLAAAVAEGPTETNRWAVVVQPGNYAEPPLKIPEWVTLRSAGGREVTVVDATTDASPLVTGVANTALVGFTLRGSGGIGVLLDEASGTQWSAVMIAHDCTVSGFATQVSATGQAAWLRLFGSSVADGVGVSGVSGCFLETASCDAYGCTTGIVADAARVSATNWIGQIGTTGAITTNGGLLVGVGYYAAGYTCGICLDGGQAELGSSKIEQCVTSVELINSSLLLTSGLLLDGPNLTTDGSSEWTGTWHSAEEEERAVNIEGELRVGSHLRPSEACFGGGDSHTLGMVAKRFDGATWTDITAELASGSGSTTFAFDGLTVGNELYIGGDVPFPGLKIVTAAAMSGGAVAADYWDGAWQPVAWMTSLADPPYTTADQAIFAEVGAHQARFGPTDGWTTETFDGDTKHWWRLRITSDIAANPRLEQVKLHTNRVEINADGFTEKFGTARVWRQVPIPTNTLEAVGATSPGDQDLWFGVLGAIGLAENAFSGVIDESVGVGIPIPFELDTSHKLRVRLKWQPSSAAAGNVTWRVFTAIATAGSVLTTTSPGVIGDGTPATVTTPAPGVTGQETISELEVGITGVVTADRPTLLLMLQREGSAGTDTYNEDVYIRPGGVELEWLTWADGRPYEAA
jgi:hypothetical protein